MKRMLLEEPRALFYETPRVELLSVDANCVMCTSGNLEDLGDGGEVDWFN